MRRDRRFQLALGLAVGASLGFPSLADVGYLGAIPLAAAAMLAFPGRAERAALQARSLLDGAVIATSLLYTSWALVLGPVFRAGQGGILEQAIALVYPAGDPGRRRPRAAARGRPARPGRGRHQLRLPHPGGHLRDRAPPPTSAGSPATC
jgi:hypothetical protein